MEDYYMQKPSQVITNITQSVEYNLYLHGKIGEPDDFMEHFAVYKTAGQDDLIRLYINSEGGNVGTGMEYIRHMRECNCPIVAVLGFDVSSMASAIALQADEIEVDEMSTMLIHSFSYGAAGNEASIFNQAKFNNKLNERWIRKYYSNFLDEDQLSDVFKGVDILLDSDEIIERWEVYQEARYAEVRDQVEHQSKTLEELVKDAVKEAMAELNPSVINTIEMSPENSERLKDALSSIKTKSSDEAGIILPGGIDVSSVKIEDGKLVIPEEVEKQITELMSYPIDGLSPETAYPYCPDSILQKGVWYKWEATEDDNEPNIHHKATGSLFWGDGEITENEVLSYFSWSKQSTVDCTIRAFKIDK